MKKQNLTIVFAIMYFVLAFTAGCADKFQTARISVNLARAATNITDVGIKTYVQSQRSFCDVETCFKLHPKKDSLYSVCLSEDHTTETTWKSCYIPAKKCGTIWTNLKPAVISAWKTADSIIDAAEKHSGSQANNLSAHWMNVIKDGVCLLSKILVFLPERHKKQIQSLLHLGGLACL